ncbi:MAG: hypothetical protein IKG11_07075 [Atopobiaceae bacterium]|nr:hypothetical protein [Atopobiaceae bacterium]
MEQEIQDSTLDQLEQIGRQTVKVAAAAVVATSIASALAEPPHIELMSLPEPVPIVQVYQSYDDDIIPDEDEDEDKLASRLRRLLKAIKYLLMALALVAGILLGTLKGCAGIAGGLLLPPAEQEQQEQRETHHQQAEDERGVAY